MGGTMRERERERERERDVYVFIFILLLTYFQSKYIGFYHDDYGYGSLVYGVTGEYSGRGLADIIAFCKDHYINWGGRVLFFFFKF